MTSTAHKTRDELKEIFDSDEMIDHKVKKLAALFRNAKHATFFTGAGVSTSSGIRDFRGPQGVWTLRAQGKAYKGKKVSTLQAVPTLTHMSIKKLLDDLPNVKFLISQNTDGLHIKSGVNPTMIAELHGNTNKELCKKCGRLYYRDFRTREASRAHSHKTSRKCDNPLCRGQLYDSIINFNENLPEKELTTATEHSDDSDLMICLGSSLRVTPAADMPSEVAERGGDLVIVNLQTTPLDKFATVRIYAKTDDVMDRLMKELNLEIPEWVLIRRVVVGKNHQHIFARGVDSQGWPVSWIKSISVHGSKKTTEPFSFEGKVKVSLETFRWYSEPTVSFEAEVGEQPVVYKCEFSPKSGVWNVQEDEDTEKILNMRSILSGT